MLIVGSGASAVLMAARLHNVGDGHMAASIIEKGDTRFPGLTG